MIIGTGIDVCDVRRIQQALERHGERFLERIYTLAEIGYCHGKGRGAAESFAARFAAKEAAAKALGTGMARGVGWLDIEVVLTDGRPTLRMCGGAAAQAARMRVDAMHLSLSHSCDIAIASVVLESRSRT